MTPTTKHVDDEHTPAGQPFSQLPQCLSRAQGGWWSRRTEAHLPTRAYRLEARCVYEDGLPPPSGIPRKEAFCSEVVKSKPWSRLDAKEFCG